MFTLFFFAWFLAWVWKEGILRHSRVFWCCLYTNHASRVDLLPTSTAWPMFSLTSSHPSSNIVVLKVYKTVFFKTTMVMLVQNISQSLILTICPKYILFLLYKPTDITMHRKNWLQNVGALTLSRLLSRLIGGHSWYYSLTSMLDDVQRLMCQEQKATFKGEVELHVNWVYLWTFLTFNLPLCLGIFVNLVFISEESSGAGWEWFSSRF